jgi:hypothetical protein
MGRPEQLGVELDESEDRRLGAQRQQRCGDEGDDEHRAEPELWQREPFEQLVQPSLHDDRLSVYALHHHPSRQR